MFKKRIAIASTISFILASGIFIYLTNNKAAANISSVSGLAVLHQLNREAIAYDVAINESKPTLIEFYADWCTTCQGMAPIVRELHQQYGDRINFVMLDIDNARWKQQIEQYRVTGVPQFTFLNEEREVKQSLVGRVPKSIFNHLFEQYNS